jgi:hypothetical protein
LLRVRLPDCAGIAFEPAKDNAALRKASARHPPACASARKPAMAGAGSRRDDMDDEIPF